MRVYKLAENKKKEKRVTAQARAQENPKNETARR